MALDNHRRGLEILLILIMTLASLSSINHFHDWGGDFAQYLNNAKDLVTGNTTQQREILDHENFTPLSRGAGFSLLLSPLYSLFHDQIAAYTTLISIAFIFVTLILFRFFLHQSFQPVVGLLLTLCFALNPDVFVQKLEILPTFPFLILLYIGFIWFNQKQDRQVLLLGIISGLMVSFRNVGWVFVLAVCLHLGFHLLRHFQWSAVLRLMAYLLVVSIVDIVVKWIVFRTLSFENLAWYDSVFTPGQMWEKMQENIRYYYDLFHLFFRQYLIRLPFTYYEKVFLLFVLMGFLTRLKQWKLTDTFLVIYMMLILSYFWQSGMRFLVPVLPIVLTYMGFGLQWLTGFLSRGRKPAILMATVLLSGLLLAGQLGQTMKIWSRAKNPVNGPQLTDAAAAFSYVENNISPTEPIAFHKPWVLHHFTDRISMAINPKDGLKGFSMRYFEDKMTRFEVKYVLVGINPEDRAIYNKDLVSAVGSKADFSEIWSNDSFVLLVKEE